MKIIWCMIPEVWSAPDRIFLLSWTIFCPFTPPNSPKNEKKPGDIIILHKCTKNHDHMLYCSWDMVHDRCNPYFSFWAIFCPFTPPPPPNSPKNQIFKKMKKTLKISSFYTGVPKIMIRWCTIPEIWCTTDGWPDAQEKWHVEVGAPPKNNLKEI